MSMLRGVLRLGLALLGGIAGAVYSGCGPAYGVWDEPMYGVELMYGVYPAYGVPIALHDPTVAIEDFSYTPASPAAGGATITFTMTTNQPTTSGYGRVRLGDYPGTQVFLNDLGQAPDETSGDAIWTGDWVVPDIPATGPLPVTTWLDWQDGWPSLKLDGPPLTIIEEGDDPQ